MGFPALMGLADFSHVWLLFVFHDNTNAMVNGVADERSPPETRPLLTSAKGRGSGSGTENGGVPSENGCVVNGEAGRVGGGGDDGEKQEGEGDERWGGGPREYRQHSHKLRQTFLTKVW